MVYSRATQNAGLNTIGMTNIPETMMTLGCTQNSLLWRDAQLPWDLSRVFTHRAGGGAAAIAAAVAPMVHSTMAAALRVCPLQRLVFLALSQVEVFDFGAN
ncbi:amidase family protein [Vibrio chagasii]|nr:amidase family protein [Vibrio chagasii]